MENIAYYLIKDTKIEYLGIDVGLDALQEAVGGYIESINPSGAYEVAYCNEEGMLQGLETNVFGIRFAKESYCRSCGIGNEGE